jgi:hypothetical protein
MCVVAYAQLPWRGMRSLPVPPPLWTASPHHGRSVALGYGLLAAVAGYQVYAGTGGGLSQQFLQGIALYGAVSALHAGFLSMPTKAAAAAVPAKHAAAAKSAAHRSATAVREPPESASNERGGSSGGRRGSRGKKGE